MADDYDVFYSIAKSFLALVVDWSPFYRLILIDAAFAEALPDVLLGERAS